VFRAFPKKSWLRF